MPGLSEDLYGRGTFRNVPSGRRMGDGMRDGPTVLQADSERMAPASRKRAGMQIGPDASACRLVGHVPCPLGTMGRAQGLRPETTGNGEQFTLNTFLCWPR